MKFTIINGKLNIFKKNKKYITFNWRNSLFRKNKQVEKSPKSQNKKISTITFIQIFDDFHSNKILGLLVH